MNNSWKEYWENHAKFSIDRDPQSQVLRTLNKTPVEDKIFKEILQDIESKMEISPNDKVLELCCGNGLITTYLASRCNRIVGVDFIPNLAEQIDIKKNTNISIIVEDITKVHFNSESFDKVIIYAGLQYLDYKNVITLFESVFRWLENNGLFFIGDIPDQERIWDFYNSQDREKVYFESVKNNKPIIGTWFNAKWLEKLGVYANFNNIKVCQQPSHFPYAHFRFDMVLKK
jgi:cyclopropane fatty-acyl-phospholipid synthase-like methyltransferase